MNQPAQTTSPDDTNDEFPIDASKVDPALVNRSLKKLKLDTKGEFSERIERLKAWILEPTNTPDEDLVSCTDCGGPSNVKTFPDECCFCGKKDDTTDSAPPPVAPAPKAEAPAPAPEKAPKEPKADKPKKAAKLAAVPSSPATVVNPSTDVSEIALDEAIKRVHTAQAAGAVSYYDLGEAVRDIYERRLYTQRRGEDGKPKYNSFDAFVKAELHLSKQHVFTMMDVSKQFDRATFTEVGITKLKFIAALAPEFRDEVLDKARKGLPTASVSREVRALMDKGHKGGGSGRKDPIGDKRGKQPNKKAPPKLASDQLTAIVTRERTKIPLFARPKSSAKDGSKPERAMKVAQDPSGMLELPNGVEMHIRIVLEARGLVAVVEYRHPEAKK